MIKIKYLFFASAIMIFVLATNAFGQDTSFNETDSKQKRPNRTKSSFRSDSRSLNYGTISGRAVTPDGRAIRGALIVLLGNDGPRFAISGSLGYFSISGIPLGEQYSLSVSHLRYLFAIPTQIIKIHTDITDILMVGESNVD